MLGMSTGQTGIVGRQTFKDFFSGGPSLHHHSGTLAADIDGSAFRYNDMHVSFPPLSASAPATTGAAHRGEMRSNHGGNRTLGTSRMTGSAAWKEPTASGKRRGSWSGVGDGSSSGQHQRQTLKLADITDFDLTRPSAFEKLSGLYRNKSALEGPSSHAILASKDKDTEGTSRSKHKAKSGIVSHHVHLPRISMDSSPPLVSFRHSRIKPSTLTEQETGIPGASQPSPRGEKSTASRTPPTQPIRKNEHSRDKNNSGDATFNNVDNSHQEIQKHFNENNNKTPLSSSRRTTNAGTKEENADPASPGTGENVPSSYPVKKETEQLTPVKKSSSVTRSETDVAASLPTPTAPERIGKPRDNLPSPGNRPTATRTSGPSANVGPAGAPNRRGKIDPADLSLSEYTSIVINNDGFEGETLSAVKSDTFLGERRTVRFSVSTEVIEYEPEVSLTGYDRVLTLEADEKPCEVIAE